MILLLNLLGLVLLTTIVHKATTVLRPLTLFWAIRLRSVHDLPVIFSSWSPDLLHVCFDITDFLFPIDSSLETVLQCHLLFFALCSPFSPIHVVWTRIRYSCCKFSFQQTEKIGHTPPNSLQMQKWYEIRDDLCWQDVTQPSPTAATFYPASMTLTLKLKIIRYHFHPLSHSCESLVKPLFRFRRQSRSLFLSNHQKCFRFLLLFACPIFLPLSLLSRECF